MNESLNGTHVGNISTIQSALTTWPSAKNIKAMP
jgi:hypothetical protein